jgi:hypothetical protein|tara:strand:+ start:13 stop:237 length:225 start_codon:yes stop_codon:yes gene_type:complete
MDSAELIDMIANNAPSSEVSDALKSMMYAKSADFVDAAAPEVAKTLFGEPEVEEDGIEAQADAEVEQEPEQEEE